MCSGLHFSMFRVLGILRGVDGLDVSFFVKTMGCAAALMRAEEPYSRTAAGDATRKFVDLRRN